MSFFGYTVLGNGLDDYLSAFAVFLLSLIVLRIFKVIIIKNIKAFSRRTKNDYDDLVVDMIDRFNWVFFVFLSFYLGLRWLELPQGYMYWVNYVMLGITLFFVVSALLRFVDFIARKLIRRHDGESESIVRFLAALVKGILWLIAILMVLSNLGINITSLVAGLGIGGIAIALALQNILGDLFASASIFFDKPFKVGDFIIVGEHMGIVKYIGIKTTRIESLWGEEIVISNSELTSTRIRNFKKMERRRIHFPFGVVYQTSPKKLKAIPGMVREIFKKVKLASLDRVHFKAFGDSSLDFEVAYYVESGDYNQYMDVQQEINLALFEKFEKEKISFAYPTRTVFLEK